MYLMARYNKIKSKIASDRITSTANSNRDNKTPWGTQVHTYAKSAEGFDRTTDSKTGAIAGLVTALILFLAEKELYVSTSGYYTGDFTASRADLSLASLAVLAVFPATGSPGPRWQLSAINIARDRRTRDGR